MRLRHGFKAHILIVDDDETTRNVLSSLLGSSDYRVTSVADARMALITLENEEIDLVISDQVMPDMTGLELIECVSELYPEISFAICSGHLSAPPPGVAAFFPKPIDFKQMLSSISLLLDRGRLQR